jgi:N utilization substance protein A
MNTGELFEALGEIVKEKGIDKELVFSALESALTSAYKKNYGTMIKVLVNRESGEIKIYAQKKVVEHIEDNSLEISLEDAKKINLRYEMDDIVDIEVTPKDFGRVAAQNVKQNVVQKIREAERQIIYKEFVEKENDILTGIFKRKKSKMYWLI